MQLIAEFMKCPEVKILFSALEAVGGKGCVRFVGGSIRNALLGEPIKDIDLATWLVPEDIEKALLAAQIKSVPTGKMHGTISAIINSCVYEITTLRSDTHTDGRHAQVTFGTDWKKDALRRDFTINALYADANGCIYDPTGQGLDDLKLRCVRFIGDPKARIAEDYLRILRFFRFSARFSINIDSEALRACGELKKGLSKLSAERIWSELLLIFGAKRAGTIVPIMYESGIFDIVLPMISWEDKKLEGFNEVCQLSDDPLLRFFSLIRPQLSNSGASIIEISRHLRLSKKQSLRLNEAYGIVNIFETFKINIDLMPSNLDVNLLKRCVYESNNQAVLDGLTLYAAATARKAALLEWAGIARQPKAVFRLKAKQLLTHIHLEGAAIGHALNQIEGKWIEAGFDDCAIEAAIKNLKS